MSVRSTTKYQVNQYSDVCINPDCSEGHPHQARFGKKTNRKCYLCGGPLRRIKGEPRGTYHSPRH